MQRLYRLDGLQVRTLAASSWIQSLGHLTPNEYAEQRQNLASKKSFFLAESSLEKGQRHDPTYLCR